MDPICPGPKTSWAPTKRDQIDTFYDQGDFGYVKQQREEITHMCEPINKVYFFITLELLTSIFNAVLYIMCIVFKL